LFSQFNDPTIHPVVRETLRLCNYSAPTPIQIYTIPAILDDRDIFAVAQAGSGKTGAYLVPIISILCGKHSKLAAPRPGLGLPLDSKVTAEPLVIVVCPTRELAIQIFDHARRLCYRTKLRPCLLYGGAHPGLQHSELNKGCDILIATPGRLVDFIQRGRVDTGRNR
jgi:ATP-dependent RNA helicase DDX3X